MADTKLVICEKCWGTGHVHGGEENSTWSKTCEDCRGIGFVRVPMTNADHIRAMSDEELAENGCMRIPYGNLCENALFASMFTRACFGSENECVSHNKKWLQQPE